MNCEGERHVSCARLHCGPRCFCQGLAIEEVDCAQYFFFSTEEHFVLSMNMKTKGLIYAEMAANGWLERPWTHFAQLVLPSPPGALVKSMRT